MKVVAGVQIHEQGQGDEVVVMIHGWPDTYRLWDKQVDALKAHYRCVRFTLPGFDITGPRNPTSLAQMVQIIRAITAESSPNKAVILMVHDWGCLFGYQFAREYPDLVARIIGLDIGDAGSRAHRQSLSTKAKLMAVGYQWWLAGAWKIGGPIGDRMTRFMAKKMRVPVDPALIGSSMNYPYFIQWTGAYGSYKAARPFSPAVPMLFIYGEKKPFMFHSPDWINKLNARDDSKALGLPAGHWMMLSQADAFNAAVLCWLEKS